MESLNKSSDWDEIIAGQSDNIQIQGIPVPYIIFENEDDVTSQGGEILSSRLQDRLSKLYQKYQ